MVSEIYETTSVGFVKELETIFLEDFKIDVKLEIGRIDGFAELRGLIPWLFFFFELVGNASA